MKNLKNTILIALGILISLTSCFDEQEDEYTVVGAVATIPVFTTPSANVNAGQTVRLPLRYYSENVDVRQVRFTQTVGTGAPSVLLSKDITDFDRNNSYVDTLDYVVPALPLNTVIKVGVEVETINDLVNSKTVNLTVK
jgi:hypothetical protein